MKLLYVLLIFLLPSCSGYQKEAVIYTKPIDKFTPFDKAPVPIVPVQPYYPETAKQAGIEGTVILQFYVNEKGNVSEVEFVKKSRSSDLDEAAVSAVKKSKWKPAQKKGKAVGVWQAIPVNFKID